MKHRTLGQPAHRPVARTHTKTETRRRRKSHARTEKTRRQVRDGFPNLRRPEDGVTPLRYQLHIFQDPYRVVLRLRAGDILHRHDDRAEAPELVRAVQYSGMKQ